VSGGEHGAYLDGQECRIIAASPRRVLATLPDETEPNGKSTIQLESGGNETEAVRITVGRRLADDMHIVANPAVDPNDASSNSGG
jgi:hypothetical protein